MNAMREIRIEKITLNIGAGKDTGLLEKGIKLLQTITPVKPVKTVTQKRIPGWGLRPGLPIGCKVTIRNNPGWELIPRLLDARANELRLSQFDENGSISFGVPEYIDIPGVKYDPEIGIIGMQVCITLKRAGFRVKKRKLYKGKIPKKHKISREDAMEFMKKNFKVKIGEEE